MKNQVRNKGKKMNRDWIGLEKDETEGSLPFCRWGFTTRAGQTPIGFGFKFTKLKETSEENK